MATYSEYLTLTSVVSRIDGRLAEEEKQSALIATCERILSQPFDDYDLQYTRTQKLEAARGYLKKLQGEMVEILLEGFPVAWRVWWEIANHHRTDPAMEGHAIRINEMACFLSDHLKRLVSAEEWNALEAQTFDPESLKPTTDEEIETLFGATRIPPGECSCGGRVQRVRSSCKNGAIQVWDRCRTCGQNVHGPGYWIPQADLPNVDDLPDYDRDAGVFEDGSGLQIGFEMSAA